jgi:tetratricopeptide (TPR) repeat protein
LAAIAQGSSNLVSVIDASFIHYDEDDVEGVRSVPGDRRGRPAVRDIGVPITRGLNAAQVCIGSLTVYGNEAIERISTRGSTRAMEGKQPGVLGRKPEIHGHLTYRLVRALAQADVSLLTYRGWFEAVRSAATVNGLRSPFFIALNHIDEPVFQNHTLKESVISLLREVDREPIDEAVVMLRRLVAERQQQGDPYPEGRLNLGIACAAAGDLAHGIQALERAISLYRDPSTMDREKERDPRAENHLREAHYQLGRLVFESGTDFTKAVSELDKAIERSRDDARAFYYLGLAIRQMVERETLAKAEDALKTYLAMGAPLGREHDVREFLSSRRRTSPGDDS